MKIDTKQLRLGSDVIKSLDVLLLSTPLTCSPRLILKEFPFVHIESEYLVWINDQRRKIFYEIAQFKNGTVIHTNVNNIEAYNENVNKTYSSLEEFVALLLV